MQLNRGTAILLVVSVVIIIGVLLINGNQGSTPASTGTTPTASPQTGGPVFAGIDTNSLVRFEIRDNTTGARTVLTRTSGDVWGLEESDDDLAFPADDASGVLIDVTAEADSNLVQSPQDTFSVETTTGQTIDQNVVLTNIGSFLSLNASDSFEADSLEEFGLVNPNHSILATSDDGTVYVLHVGGQNPSGNRYYAVVEQLAGADISTDEGITATEEPLAVATISIGEGQDQGVVSDNIQGAELTDIPDAAVENAVVEIVENTEEAAELSAMIEATNAAAAEQAATEEAASDDNTSADATEDPGVAVATQLVEEGESIGSSEQVTSGTDLGEATDEAGIDAPVEGTAEITAPPAPQPTATLAPLAEPLVTLEGAQTVYTLPRSALDTLIALITEPPVADAVATMQPSLQVEQPEVTVETAPVLQVTISAEQLTPAAAEETDAEMTEEAAATPTPAP